MSDSPSDDIDFGDLREALAASPAALMEYWRFLESHYDDVQADTQGAIARLPSFATVAPVTNPVMQDPKIREERHAMYKQAFVDGNWAPYRTFIHEIGRQFGLRGMGFEEYSSLIYNLRRRIARRIKRELAGEPDRIVLTLAGLELFLGMAMAFIGEGYMLAKGDVIRAQQQEILELSTPVLQIRDRVLVMPLIGELTSIRAEQVTTAMLEALRSARALFLIIDVTGVPVVDSGVALHFARSAEAARLMGARVIITGISTALAQSMVSIGADLGRVATFNTLQAGLEAAEQSFDRLKLRNVPDPAKR